MRASDRIEPRRALRAARPPAGGRGRAVRRWSSAGRAVDRRDADRDVAARQSAPAARSDVPRAAGRRATRSPTRTITRRVPRGAVPATSPNDTSCGAGATIAGGRSGEHRQHRSCLHHGDPRASRSRRVLRRGRGARAAGAAPQAARRRRRPAGPRRRLDGELRRAAVRHPLGDELRRGAAPLPRGRLRPAAAQRSTASTRRRSGPRSARSCRASSARASTRATSTSTGVASDFSRARAVAGGGADVGARGDEPLVLARRRAVEGRRQGRVRPAQARRHHRRAGRDRGRLPRALRRPRAAGSRAARGGAAGAPPA